MTSVVGKEKERKCEKKKKMKMKNKRERKSYIWTQKLLVLGSLAGTK